MLNLSIPTSCVMRRESDKRTLYNLTPAFLLGKLLFLIFPPQRDCLQFVLNASPQQRFMPSDKKSLSYHVWYVVDSKPFEYFIMLLIVLNSVQLMMKVFVHYSISFCASFISVIYMIFICNIKTNALIFFIYVAGMKFTLFQKVSQPLKS